MTIKENDFNSEKTNLIEELSEICPFTRNFIKEHKAFWLIQHSLEHLENEDKLKKVKLEVLKFWHLFQLKNFFFRMGKQVAIENKVVDLQKNKIIYMMVDDLLWRIPELPIKEDNNGRSTGINKKKHEVAKFKMPMPEENIEKMIKCLFKKNPNSNRKALKDEQTFKKYCKKQHLEHPVPRKVIKKYLVLKSEEVSKKSSPKKTKDQIIKECSDTIDRIMKLNFTVSMYNYYNEQLIEKNKDFDLNNLPNDLNEIEKIIMSFEGDPFWRYEDLKNKFALINNEKNKCGWDYKVKDDILGINKLTIGNTNYIWENNEWKATLS